MSLICIIFGHKYRLIFQDQPVKEKKEIAKQKFDDYKLYKRKRCRKEIVYAEHYE